MSDLTVQGRVVGLKPRGQKGGFWTVEIDQGTQYPLKLSLNQYDRDDNPTGFYELVQEAMAAGDVIEAEYYETEGEYKGKPVTYRNGTRFTYPTGPQVSEGTGDSVEAESPPASRHSGTPVSSGKSEGAGDKGGAALSVSSPPGTSASSGSSKDDYGLNVSVSWAIKTAVPLHSFECQTKELPIDNQRLHELAHRILILQQRMVSELKKDEGWS